MLKNNNAVTYAMDSSICDDDEFKDVYFPDNITWKPWDGYLSSNDNDKENEYEQYAKKVTLKAVNAALPRTTYFNAYRRTEDTGAFPHNIRTLETVVARLYADGDVDITAYAYGDGQTPDDYYGRGICAYITDIIIDWHWKNLTTRKETVALIRDRLQAARDE